MYQGKIFCIGFHKTGTTSLAQALKILGYRVRGPVGRNDPDIAQSVHRHIDEALPHSDAFQDNPWPIVFRYLDEKHPGSKFIVTWRDPQKWLRSAVKHFGEEDTPMRAWIYGVGHPAGNEQVYLDRYNRHYEEVREYFAERPQDVLFMNMEEGYDWGPLCSFLDAPIPKTEFPHRNTRAEVILRKVRKVWKRGVGLIKRPARKALGRGGRRGRRGGAVQE